MPGDDENGGMSLLSIHDQAELKTMFGRDPALHLYELGDLDDFFWPRTNWYRLDGGEAVALLYTAPDPPVLLALGRKGSGPELRQLLSALTSVLPRRVYAHVTDGVQTSLTDVYAIEHHGRYLKMSLTDETKLGQVTEDAEAKPLTTADRADVETLYALSYPGNWFDARMLDTGQYVGIRRDGELVAVAGVHVYSAAQRVAALGNVTTRPDHRGHGLATRTITALCRQLSLTVDHIGLNVKADNHGAVKLYRRLGFSLVRDYHEATLTAR